MGEQREMFEDGESAKRVSPSRTPEYANDYQRKKRARKKAAGICVMCAAPSTAGLTTCDKHRAASSAEYQRKMAAERVAKGICRRCNSPAEPGLRLCGHHRRDALRWRRAKSAKGVCGKCPESAVPGKKFCEACLEASRANRRKRLEDGVCVRCATPAEPGRQTCSRCRKALARRERKKARRLTGRGVCRNCYAPSGVYSHCEPCRERGRAKRSALKVETLNAYGGCFCVCCGERRLEFLTLDHPDDDGAAHRRSIADISKAGSGFYAKLRAAGFPKSPRLVVNCFNCNVGRGFHGYCPHQREREAWSGGAGI